MRPRPHRSTPWPTTICATGSKPSKKHGELKRIREEVSPELEITEITDRVTKIGARGMRLQRRRGNYPRRPRAAL